MSILAMWLSQHMSLRLAKLSAWGIVVALCALALYLAYSWAWDRGRDAERDRWEAAVAKIEAAAAKADAKALTTAAQTKGQVDATNQRAADDAARSDDPLRAGLERLRAEGKAGSDQASR
ncbi:MAG TPA: hypothetical protein PKD48_02040 [Sphingopyxis sp.]|nr:hypothetical protein [Sphingopyxis sp.]